MTNEEAVTPQIVDGTHQLAVEISAQRSIALSNPRDVKKVLATVLAELTIAPEFAEDAYYSIEYGKGENMSIVEGLSVKASRAVGRLWGNCAIGSRIISEDSEVAEVEGVFVDIETNTFFRRPVRVAKTYIPRGSSIPVPLKGTHLTNAIQAGLSKAERNATLSGLPEWFKDRVFTAAKQIAGSKDKGVKTDAERMEACFIAFVTFGVDRNRVAAYVEAKLKGKGTDEIIGTMKGVYNSLRDKQTTADEVFTPAAAKPAEGAVKLADIMPKKGGELL